MSERQGTTVHWVIDGKGEGLGYFQRWALPVPGDRVLMQEGRVLGGERKDFTVEVTHRMLSQPEQDSPWIVIHARRVDPHVTAAGLADATVALDDMSPDQRNHMVEAVCRWLKSAGYQITPPHDVASHD